VRYRFGDVVFDPDTRQIFRAGEEVHVSPKAFDLLQHLIDQRPRALTRRELHEHLWPSTFVSETSLGGLVAEIRAALNDAVKEPRYIRTAHRFGYAFCAEVATEPAQAPTAIAARAEGPAQSPNAGFCWLTLEGRRLALRSGENILGRDLSDEGVYLESPTVSRRHARIVVTATGASLEDLESKNGTFVRGRTVTTPVPLTDGDELRVGSVTLRFRMASPETSTWSEPAASNDDGLPVERTRPVQDDGDLG
jgi:DNA-binding winged helix-turn-helix (wHTH) protein